MKSELRALLFDVDGTLADTEEVHRQAFNGAFKAAGLDWVWSIARYHDLLSVTGGKERIRHYMQQEQPGDELPPDTDAFIAALHADKTSIYVSKMTEGRVVSALFKHSFGGHEDDWFEVVAAGNVVPRKKPAPDIYEYAMSKLGLSAADCLALEDSANGLKSALAAGVDVLVTVNQFTDKQEFSGAAVVLDHLGEPDSPCHMLQGCLQPGPFVDVEYLRRLHAVCQEAGG
jgi:beta-phosphoglucomutase-like phosphatase (HAD superfamily)